MGEVRSRQIQTAAVVIAATLVAAACGGGSSSSGTSPAGTSAAPAPTVSAAPTVTVTDATTAPPPSDAPAPTSAPLADGAKPIVGGKLVAAVEAETATPWMPAKMSCANGCSIVGRSFYETLFTVNKDRELVGLLAESYTQNADFTEMTITLRSGITFSDGTPFDADAVVDNINRYRASFLIGKALEVVTDAKALDPLTVVVTTRTPLADGPYYFANMQPGSMASPTWMKAADADPSLESRPVGTGPFVMTSYSPGSTLTVKRNPTYWRKDAEGVQLPYLDEVEFRVITDDITRRKALENGEIDIANTQSGETIMELASAKGVVSHQTFEFTDSNYIMFNLTADAPTSNKNLRCGLMYGYNQEAAKEALAGGFDLALANGLFAPGQPGYLADNGFNGYDPDKAKAFIEAWKAETNGGSKVILTTVPDQQALATAEYIQADWNDIGVEVEVKTIEQGALINNALLGSSDFNAFTWRNHSGFLVDGGYVWWHSSQAVDPPGFSLNFGRLRDPIIDQALDANRAEGDGPGKQAFGEAINKQFASECYVVPQYWTPWTVVHRDYVQGYGSKSLVDGSVPLPLTGLFGVGSLWIDKK
jgi:peptide/nickel transport system substrate-binding protein